MTMTAKERHERAVKAARARWAGKTEDERREATAPAREAFMRSADSEHFRLMVQKRWSVKRAKAESE